MKKLEFLSVLLAVTLMLTAINTFLIFGVGGQINAFQSAVVLAQSSNGQLKKAEPLQGGTPPVPSANQAAPDLAEIADDDPSIGPKNAKVTVVEFSDFECPYCAAVAGTHAQLVAQFKSRDPSWEAAVPKLKELAKEGKIKFVYRDFPLSFHQNAQKAAEAAECADLQGKFWEMHDKIFENQTAIDAASLKQYAKDIGLDLARFNQCLDSGEMAAEVKKDFADGTKFGVSGTPAFFINGTEISGAQSFSVFKQVIDAELAKGGA